MASYSWFGHIASAPVDTIDKRHPQGRRDTSMFPGLGSGSVLVSEGKFSIEGQGNAENCFLFFFFFFFFLQCSFTRDGPKRRALCYCIVCLRRGRVEDTGDRIRLWEHGLLTHADPAPLHSFTPCWRHGIHISRLHRIIVIVVDQILRN
jgi:hypothetical protein